MKNVGQKNRNRFQKTPENAYANIKNWTSRIIQILLISLIILIIYTIHLKLSNPDTLPFRLVKIEAPLNYVKPQKLTTAVQSGLFGGFFSLNVKRLQQSLLNIPWISGVSLRRIWPDKLIITIMEYQPLALWQGTGVVSKSGIIFYPSIDSIPKDLPIFYGDKQDIQKIISRYQTINQMLRTISLNVASLTLTERSAWQILMNNGILVMVGRQNVNQRLQQFVQLYPRIIGAQAKQVARVDLRYPNGLAIQWNKK